MISMALVRCYEASEVGKNAQSQLLAFLRMELASEEPIGGNARYKRITVIRRRRDNRAIIRDDVE
jgi:hypothetical protein